MWLPTVDFESTASAVSPPRPSLWRNRRQVAYTLELWILPDLRFDAKEGCCRCGQNEGGCEGVRAVPPDNSIDGSCANLSQNSELRSTFRDARLARQEAIYHGKIR